jgi:hypothetical protein
MRRFLGLPIFEIVFAIIFAGMVLLPTIAWIRSLFRP